MVQLVTQFTNNGAYAVIIGQACMVIGSAFAGVRQRSHAPRAA